MEDVRWEGSSAHSWRIWHNGDQPCHGGYVTKMIHVENETEELIALQALETYRALQHAVKTAPHGKGLATVEAVIHDKGFAQLAKMYEAAVREHPEAQKKGSAL